MTSQYEQDKAALEDQIDQVAAQGQDTSKLWQLWGKHEVEEATKTE